MTFKKTNLTVDTLIHKLSRKLGKHRDFVLSYLNDIKEDLMAFTAQDTNPIFWAWYGAYDWVAISQLFGRMLDVPVNWPHLVMDVKQLCVMLGNPKVPEQKTTKHHALNDAIWTKEVYNFLVKKLSN